MIAAASVAILVNGIVAWSLHGSAKNDLNVRSAYLHMLGDALSAVGVVIAGVIVAVSHNSLADPIVSLLIGVMILWSSWGVLKESVNVLLEATPKGLDMPALEQGVRAVPGVLGVHDLHVWTVASGIVACSCHVLVSEQSVREGQQGRPTMVMPEGVPPSLREVVWSRVRTLGQDVFAVLTAASVLGLEFPEDVLLETLDLPG